jgi:peptidoglycan/xylan/chitin deacetylase (PgdA/CDA1 family)
VLASLNLAQAIDIQSWMAGLKQAMPAVRMKLVERAESLAGETMPQGLYRPMSINQVMELSRRGHEIGSHTITHPILPQLDDDQLKNELERSAERLREWTGTDVIGFCYPNGDLDERVERAVLDAGYQYACAMHSDLNRRGVALTRLARLPVTMRRAVRAGCVHDAIGFRAELCRLREWFRVSVRSI